MCARPPGRGMENCDVGGSEVIDDLGVVNWVGYTSEVVEFWPGASAVAETPCEVVGGVRVHGVLRLCACARRHASLRLTKLENLHRTTNATTVWSMVGCRSRLR